jgi:hypothetical protein
MLHTKTDSMASQDGFPARHERGKAVKRNLSE